MIQSRLALISLRDEATATRNLVELNTLRNQGFKIVAHGETEAFVWLLLEKGEQGSVSFETKQPGQNIQVTYHGEPPHERPMSDEQWKAFVADKDKR